MNNIRKSNGVTLIALAVTAIVLLIISAITISTFLGENGIIKNANSSKEMAGIVEEKEILNTTIAAAIGVNPKAKVEETYLRKYLNENVGKENKDYSLTSEENIYKVKFLKTGNEYIVLKSGKILDDGEYKNNLTIEPGGNLTLEVGDTSEITAITNEEKSGISWIAEDDKIVEIIEDFNDNSNITIKGIKNGTTKVISKISNGDTAICEVTVQTSPDSIEIIPSSVSLDLSKNKTAELTTKILPDSANVNREITWKSENTNIAVVDENGLVTGVANGNTTITATTKNGKKATCSVEVNTSSTGVWISDTSIILDTSNMAYSNTYKLSAGALPSSSNVDNTINWVSSKTSVATVDENGNVTAVKAGRTTITAMTPKGNGVQCSVRVITSIKSIVLSPKSETLETGQTLQLTATIEPDSYVGDSLQWTSSNTSVATVSDSGLVTAKNVGTATITLKNSNGNVSDTCTINVIKKYNSSEIDYGFYGELVTNYHGPDDGGMKYRIFYAEDDSVYLIADDYIHYTQAPIIEYTTGETAIVGHKGTGYRMQCYPSVGSVASRR